LQGEAVARYIRSSSATLAHITSREVDATFTPFAQIGGSHSFIHSFDIYHHKIIAVMRLLTLVPALLPIAALASAAPKAASDIEIRESATDLFLDGISSILIDTDPSLIVKRQNETSPSGPPPIGDALDDLLNGGFFGELLDLLRDSDNIFTPEWNDRFGELVDSVAPVFAFFPHFSYLLL
jgi:hypothetical protein